MRKLRIKLETLTNLLFLAVYAFFVVFIVDAIAEDYGWAWWLELAVVLLVAVAGVTVYWILKAFIEVVP